jgi:phosphatidylglycerol:prolipoprotein diacylglycerol transferase
MWPVLFRVGDVTVYSYGVLHLIAMVGLALLGAVWLRRHAVEPAVGVDAAVLYPICMFLLGGVLFNLLKMGELSLSSDGFWGGYSLFLPALALYAAIRRFPVLKLLDLLSPAVMVAVGLGKVGCFLGGCCWGRATSGFWGMMLPGTRSLGVLQHPVPLYDFLWAFLVTALLLWQGRRARTPGLVFVLFLLLFSGERFLTELLRADYVGATRFMGLYLSQIVELVVFLGAVSMGIALLYRQRRGAAAERPARDEPAPATTQAPSIARRLLAAVIDLAIPVAFMIAASVASAGLRTPLLVLALVSFVGLQVLPASPGRFLLRLSLLTASGAPAPWARRLVRAVSMPIAYGSVVGVFRPLISSSRQALYDMLARTHVRRRLQ